jgi:signal transduction histidine kinase
VLVDQVRRGELDVTVHVEGDERALPAVVELSAYRVVQEALTNALKHGGPGTRAEVRLTYRPEVLDVRVVDDGAGHVPVVAGSSGRGLLGMRERVALHGGTLDVGPRPGGGWLVRACLPVAV